MKTIKNFILATTLLLAVQASASTNYFLGFFDLKKLGFVLEEEFRLKDTGGSPFVYNHTDFQIKYAVVSYADIFADYRLILQDKGKGWDDQSVFLTGFTLKYPEQKWGRLSLRNRLEIAFNEDKPDSYTYRLNPKYSTPWKWTKFKFNPFVADEMFFDTLHAFDFTKNRIYAGFDYQITKKIKGSTFYMHEDVYTKGGTPSDTAVTQIKFEF